MIIWLASYPRSGNTYLRSLLSRCFGVTSFSLYDDADDIGAEADLSSIVGHANHSLQQHKFYNRARRARDTYFIKTHDGPRDHAKAIYIIRDGRSAIVSYYHYLSSFGPTNVKPPQLRQIITGDCSFGSWSNHLRVWDPVDRPNTLVLRYDALVRDSQAALDQIAHFIDRPILQRDAPSFAELQKVNSRFFRAGNDIKNIAELEGADLDLFWATHGWAMNEFGFY